LVIVLHVQLPDVYQNRSFEKLTTKISSSCHLIYLNFIRQSIILQGKQYTYTYNRYHKQEIRSHSSHFIDT